MMIFGHEVGGWWGSREGVRGVFSTSRGGYPLGCLGTQKMTTILLRNAVPHHPVSESSTKMTKKGVICSVFPLWEGVGEGRGQKVVFFAETH